MSNLSSHPVCGEWVWFEVTCPPIGVARDILETRLKKKREGDNLR